MAKKEINKLVRDYFPNLLKEKGIKIDYEVLSYQEFSEKLLAQFQEEAEKFSKAQTDRLITNMVELLEVMYAIAEHRGITEAEVDFMRQLKKSRNGGFRKRIYVKSISE